MSTKSDLRRISVSHELRSAHNSKVDSQSLNCPSVPLKGSGMTTGRGKGLDVMEPSQVAGRFVQVVVRH
jgi:hypothetical protein